MSSFESMVIISHARKMLRMYGTKRAASYLAKNGVCITVALALCTNKYGNASGISNELLASLAK